MRLTATAAATAFWPKTKVPGYRGTGRVVRGDAARDCATANLENRTTMAPEVRFPTRRAVVIESQHAQRSDDYPTSRRVHRRMVSRCLPLHWFTGYHRRRRRVSGLLTSSEARLWNRPRARVVQRQSPRSKRIVARARLVVPGARCRVVFRFHCCTPRAFSSDFHRRTSITLPARPIIFSKHKRHDIFDSSNDFLGFVRHKTNCGLSLRRNARPSVGSCSKDVSDYPNRIDGKILVKSKFRLGKKINSFYLVGSTKKASSRNLTR